MTPAPQLSVSATASLQSSFWREGRLRRMASVSAALAGCVACLGFAGWYGQLARLLRFGAGYGAVQFNSILCLLLIAGALGALAHGRTQIARPLALGALLISGLTLIEHVTGWSAGIDQVLWHFGVNRAAMTAFTVIPGSPPGRMPTNGSLGFVLLGLALTFASSHRMTQRRLLICATAALATATIGAVAFAGYLFGIPLQYGWGASARMPVAGAWTFVIIGVGTLAAVVLAARRASVPTRRVVPAMAATIVAVAGLLLWESLLDHDRRNLETAVRHHAKAMAGAIAQSVDMRARVVDRMSQRKTSSSVPNDQAKAAAAMQVMRDFPGIQSIALLDSLGRIVWRSAGGTSSEDIPGARFDRAPARAALLAEAWRDSQAVVATETSRDGKTATLLIASRSRAAVGPSSGFIVIEVQPQRLLADVLPDEFAGQYGYTLTDGDVLLGTRGDMRSQHSAGWVVTAPVNVRGRRWQVTIVPSLQTMQEFSSGIPTAFLIGALVCTIIAAWIVRAAQLAHEQSDTLTLLVAQLAAENEARGLAEELRDRHAALLRAQSGEFEQQNEQLQSALSELAEQRDALAREQEFGAALVRSTVDGVAAFDRQGCVHAWNPAMASLTGRPLGEVEGSVIGTLLPFLNHGEEVRLLQEALQGRATELTAVRAEHALWHDEVWLDLTVTPMRTADGKVVGGLLVARDVTESQRVAEVILASKDSAEQANRAKSDFLARMSHELRTPLNAVIGFTNVLLRNRRKRLEKDEITFLERIGANGRHLLTLINEVLDLSKIEAGHESVSMSRTPITKLVRDTVADLEVRATEAGVHLEIDTPLHSHAHTDGAKLKQVLINLVGNAIKFTPRGGTVTVRVLESEGTGETDRIEVRDTGIGIPQDRLEAIFEAFEQADSQTSLKYGGTGLGLAISQKLCELMGHCLVVDSEPGKGSTFSILLTATRSALAA